MTAQIAFMKTAIKNRIDTNVIPGIGVANSSTAAACELTDSGRPTVPYQGIAFLAVHSGKRRTVNASPGAFYLDEYYDFRVTISMKSANKPRYRFGDLVINDTDSGLQYLADLVIVSLNGYLSLAEEANSLLAVSFLSHQPFITGEVPIFQGAGDPVERYGDWFGATIDRRSANELAKVNSPMGISLELRFAGLHLIRPIGQA